jgi:hypothetical protein
MADTDIRPMLPTSPPEPPSSRHEPRRQDRRILAGVVIILAGLSLLADRTGYHFQLLPGRLWPLILIAFGVVRLTDRGRPDGSRRSARSGAWFIFLGIWGLVSEFHLFGLDYNTSWPLLVVAAGVLIVWRAFEHPGGCGRSVQGS